MDFTIRTIDFTATGREIVREREVSSARLTIGRASENAIHLPDLAVEQQHLVLVPQSNGALRAEAVSTLGFRHDGRNVREATIDPGRPAEFEIGSYRLSIDWSAAGKPTITQLAVSRDAGEVRDKLRGFGLEGAMPSRRAVSWIAALGILAAFLAIPIFTHLTRPDVEPDIKVPGTVLMDASWSTGPLSFTHHGLEDNCEACHTEPFVAVRDETCIVCHGELEDHARPSRMADGRAPHGAGEAALWQIAHAFGKPGPGACTDCHTEHEGKTRMQPPAQQFCADCHETLDTRLTDTTLGNAADFGTAHPEFKALVIPARGARPERISLDDNPRNFGGLKFPHDMHLSTTNGVARMASRLDPRVRALDCASCHEEESDGVSFQPVNMEQACEDCHSLVYDKVGSTFRSLRHGNVAEMQADLLAADRSRRMPVNTGRRRPGEFAQGGLYYSNFGRAMPGRLTRAALAPDGMCGECHYPAAGGGLDVEEVVQTQRFFLKGWFDHEAHKEEDCTSCHAAESSKRASDLLMPDLASCRDCHEGEAALEAEVPSNCAMCHSYHPRSGPAAAPPKLAKRVR